MIGASIVSAGGGLTSLTGLPTSPGNTSQNSSYKMGLDEVLGESRACLSKPESRSAWIQSGFCFLKKISEVIPQMLPFPPLECHILPDCKSPGRGQLAWNSLVQW